MTPGAVQAESVSRRFRVEATEARTLKELVLARGRGRATDVWALRDVSFAIEPGEAVGLVGRNGSGKTTLLKLVSGILKPTGGTLAVGGRVGSLLELGAGFHPDFSGRENVFLNGAIHGLSRAQVRERMDEIVSFAGLEEAIDLPVRTYSSGMTMRLGFAVAAHVEADLLLLDEVFAVGDEAFQRKCFGKIFEFKQRGGTIVFVSHDASAVERLCDRAILLRHGRRRVRRARRTTRSCATTASSPRRRTRPSAAPGCASGGAARRGSRRSSSSAPTASRGTQFLAGEGATLRLQVSAERPLPAPRLSWELRGEGGILLAAGLAELGDLGWDGGAPLPLRFGIEQLPLADGRFTFRLALTDPESGRLLHHLDDAAALLVYPGGDERGLVRVEGSWAREESGAAAELRHP